MNSQRRKGAPEAEGIQAGTARASAPQRGDVSGLGSRRHPDPDAWARAALLFGIGTALAGPEELPAKLDEVLRLAVDCFAIWGAVLIDDGDGQVHKLAAHAEPGQGLWARKVWDDYVLDGYSSPVLRVIRSRAAILLPAEPESGGCGEDQRFLADMQASAALVIPIVVSGKTSGILAMFRTGRDAGFSQDDLALAEEIGRRVSIASENVALARALHEVQYLRDRFLPTLAHELRTPLAPIQNTVHLLRLKSSGDAEVQQAIALIERQVHQLTRLVDDLLDVSRISHGKLDLRMEQVAIAAVINTALESNRALIDSRGHELTLCVPADPIYVKGDPARLTQIVSNLLNNAAKFTERGGHMWLSADQQRHTLVLRVQDNGIGIRAEMQAHIFDMFVQGDTRSVPSPGGLGIGLSLVRQLVKMHGGTVEVHSDGLGRGSTFIVRLPIAKDEAGDLASGGR
jgi:signal transduction histidine kinase